MRALCEELLAAAAADVTAIVAGNDLMALGCYDVLAERGLRVRSEVSVVGFNDMPFAGHFHPPLTTVRIPHYEIGRGGRGPAARAPGAPAHAGAPAHPAGRA